MLSGKISKEEVEALKKSLAGVPIYKWPTPDQQHDLVFKWMTQEVKTMIDEFIDSFESRGENAPIQEVYEKIFDYCVVWPKMTADDKLKLPVGIIPSVVKSIHEKSGYVAVDILGRVVGPDIVTTTVSEPVSWGEPTNEELETLKSNAFGARRLRIGKFVFVIRPMTRLDVNIAAQADDRQLALCTAVTMWPTNLEWEKLPAGFIEVIGRKASDISGWDDTVTVEEL